MSCSPPVHYIRLLSALLFQSTSDDMPCRGRRRQQALCCAGEKSYSHHTDMDVGLTVTDRVTYHGLQWFNRVGVTSNATVQDFLNYVGCALWQNFWLKRLG